MLADWLLHSIRLLNELGYLRTMGFELTSVLMKLGISTTSDHASVVSINIFVTLLCACIVLGHLLEESKWMNESITALAIVSVGIIIYSYGA